MESIQQGGYLSLEMKLFNVFTEYLGRCDRLKVKLEIGGQPKQTAVFSKPGYLRAARVTNGS